jgi:hypothetical protein
MLHSLWSRVSNFCTTVAPNLSKQNKGAGGGVDNWRLRHAESHVRIEILGSADSRCHTIFGPATLPDGRNAPTHHLQYLVTALTDIKWIV